MIKKTNVYTGKWREASHGEKFQREHMTTDGLEGRSRHRLRRVPRQTRQTCFSETCTRGE